MSLEMMRSDLLRTGNFIAGKWCPARNGAQFEVADPSTNEAFAVVADSGADDAREAADAAQAAFEGWRSSTARDRARFLKRWHALILANAEDLGRLVSREQGKPIAEGRGEVTYGASYVEWFAEEAVRAYGDIIPTQVQGRRQLVLKEPVGVVAAITPWNYPLAIPARKFAAALAAGCTVVAKPSEDTPLTVLALARLAEEAGLPPGVLNVVTASRARTPEAVDAWLADPRVRKVTFTGSTPVGKHLARESAGTLKKLSLELGGNAPFIVFDDADVDAAVDGLMLAKFRNGGQTCVCPNRIYIQDGIYDRFVQKLVARIAALRVGPASREDSQIGPMINGRAVDKIEGHVKDAIAQGAKLLAGGERLRNDIADGPHYFIPTVLGDVTPSMRVYNEETFGPVAPLCRFTEEKEAIRLANDTPFGLASYFYARDVARIWRVTEQLQTGVVGVNDGMPASEVAPFGGVKESGYGREGSRYGLDDYMHTKYMCMGNLG